MRFSLITIPGRIVERSRELINRLVKGHPALELYLEARRRGQGNGFRSRMIISVEEGAVDSWAIF